MPRIVADLLQAEQQNARVRPCDRLEGAQLARLGASDPSHRLDRIRKARHLSGRHRVVACVYSSSRARIVERADRLAGAGR